MKFNPIKNSTHGLLVAGVLWCLSFSSLSAREIKTYSGPYEGGRATYSYYEDEEENRIYHGPFKEVFAGNTITGTYKEGKMDGTWIYKMPNTFFGKYNLRVTYKDDVLDGPLVWSYTRGKQPYCMVKLTMKNGKVVGYEGLVYPRGDAWEKIDLKGGFDEDGYPDGVWEYIYQPYSLLGSGGDKHSIREVWRNGVLVKGRDKNLATGEIERYNKKYNGIRGSMGHSVEPEKFFEAYDSISNTACVDGYTYALEEGYIKPGSIGEWDLQDGLSLPHIPGSFVNREDVWTDKSFKGVPVRSIKVTGRCTDPAAVAAAEADETIYTSVEQAPQFPGGESALYKYVESHIRYPEAAAAKGISGRVTVQFVVRKDGGIGEVKILRSKDPDLDKEAIRVIKSLPAFTPAKNKGYKVNVWYTMPVSFRL